MSEHYVPAMIDACTQTPFPGSELLDPNPFVKSPIKAKPASARESGHRYTTWKNRFV